MPDDYTIPLKFFKLLQVYASLATHTRMSLKTDAKLAHKKYRSETGLFIVEGRKSILELLNSDFEILRIYVTLEESVSIDPACTLYQTRTGNRPPLVTVVHRDTLSSLGTLETSSAGLAVARMRRATTEEAILHASLSEFVLILDGIQDPGNFGTIIRTADWFGITHIVTSPTTVDAYNPKVIRASMGSFTRVEITELPLESLISRAQEQNIPSFGAFLDGKNVYETTFGKNGFIIMGSESHGISDEVASHTHERITIPRYGAAESLNVGVATALILSELRKH